MSTPYTAIHRLRGWQLQALRRWPALRPRYTLADGAPFVLHPGDRLSELIYTGRGYEPVESAFCRRYLLPGDLALDIGANVGYFTALFSRCVGPDGTVVAFEPGHNTHALLRETIGRLQLANVTTLPLALWRRAELLAFHASRSGDDAQQSVAQRDKQGRGAVLQPVAALSFTEIAASDWFQALPPPALLKIDVEGAEPQVLDGLEGYLDMADPPPLLIEFNTEALTALGNAPGEMLQQLQHWYELLATPLCWPPWFSPQRGFAPFDAPTAGGEQELNLLALPRRGRWRQRVLQALG